MSSHLFTVRVQRSKDGPWTDYQHLTNEQVVELVRDNADGAGDVEIIPEA